MNSVDVNQLASIINETNAKNTTKLVSNDKSDIVGQGTKDSTITKLENEQTNDFIESKIGKVLSQNVMRQQDWTDVSDLLEYPALSEVLKEVYSVTYYETPNDASYISQVCDIIGSKSVRNSTNDGFIHSEPYRPTFTSGYFSSVWQRNSATYQDFTFGIHPEFPGTCSSANSKEVKMEYSQILKTTLADIVDPNKIMLRELIPMQQNSIPGGLTDLSKNMIWGGWSRIESGKIVPPILPMVKLLSFLISSAAFHNFMRGTNELDCWDSPGNLLNMGVGASLPRWGLMPTILPGEPTKIDIMFTSYEKWLKWSASGRLSDYGAATPDLIQAAGANALVFVPILSNLISSGYDLLTYALAFTGLNGGCYANGTVKPWVPMSLLNAWDLPCGLWTSGADYKFNIVFVLVDSFSQNALALGNLMNMQYHVWTTVPLAPLQLFRSCMASPEHFSSALQMCRWLSGSQWSRVLTLASAKSFRTATNWSDRNSVPGESYKYCRTDATVITASGMLNRGRSNYFEHLHYTSVYTAFKTVALSKYILTLLMDKRLVLHKVMIHGDDFVYCYILDGKFMLDDFFNPMLECLLEFKDICDLDLGRCDDEQFVKIKKARISKWEEELKQLKKEQKDKFKQREKGRRKKEKENMVTVDTDDELEKEEIELQRKGDILKKSNDKYFDDKRTIDQKISSSVREDIGDVKRKTKIGNVYDITSGPIDRVKKRIRNLKAALDAEEDDHITRFKDKRDLPKKPFDIEIFEEVDKLKDNLKTLREESVKKSSKKKEDETKKTTKSDDDDPFLSSFFSGLNAQFQNVKPNESFGSKFHKDSVSKEEKVFHFADMPVILTFSELFSVCSDIFGLDDDNRLIVVANFTNISTKTSTMPYRSDDVILWALGSGGAYQKTILTSYTLHAVAFTINAALGDRLTRSCFDGGNWYDYTQPNNDIELSSTFSNAVLFYNPERFAAEILNNGNYVSFVGSVFTRENNKVFSKHFCFPMMISDGQRKKFSAEQKCLTSLQRIATNATITKVNHPGRMTWFDVTGTVWLANGSTRMATGDALYTYASINMMRGDIGKQNGDYTMCVPRPLRIEISGESMELVFDRYFILPGRKDPSELIVEEPSGMQILDDNKSFLVPKLDFK